MRLRELVEQNPDRDERSLAKRALKVVDTDDLVEVIAEEIAHVRRALVARQEKQQLDEIFAAAKSRGRKIVPIPVARSAVFEETFRLGDGRRVEWGKATAEEHEARASFLEKMANSTLATAKRHRDAAAAIRSAGVQCLEEIAA